MQYEKAKELKEKWIADGNKQCEHPHLVKEYYNGQDSGDMVCDTCGEAFAPNEVAEMKKRKQ